MEDDRDDRDTAVSPGLPRAKTHGVGVDAGHGRGVATTEEDRAESQEASGRWNDACLNGVGTDGNEQ